MKEIALQAGVSLATVDRVLHKRPGVSEGTQRRVWQAWDELSRQRQKLGLKGLRLFVDVVLDTPARFAQLVREALGRHDASGPGAHFRWRIQHQEEAGEAVILACLRQAAQRPTHGVLLKALATPAVVAAATALQAQGVPVITLVTDLPAVARLAYVGPDNAAAGHTAAYLMRPFLAARPQGQVLMSASDTQFLGESQRLTAFAQTLQAMAPGWRAVLCPNGQGLAETTQVAVGRTLQAHADIAAVYSVGGANRAILRAFAQAGRSVEVFVGHDLDEDNRSLLHSGQLQFVLHHRLEDDLLQACAVLLQHHGLAAPGGPVARSAVEVVTPYNAPAERGL